MVEAVSLTELPPRPPTPPRSSGSRAISFPEGVHQAPLAAADDITSTPQLSPHPIPSSTASKRVNFSPLTSYIKTPPFPSSGNKTRTPLRTLPPSNLCKPAKSILKATCVSPVVASSDDPQSNSQGGFPAMLESVMQQLAGDSPSSRSDAYKQLLGALTAYQDMPDTNALKEKIGPISQFIRRDITEISGTYQPQDMKLVRQALNLLTFFVWKQELAACLTDDFKTFIIDHSINILKSSSVPKSCVIDYMRFLSVQSFPPKTMTTARVSQLLSALKDVTDRVEGKAVVAQRIHIYGQLLVQARQTLASQAALWMDHLVTGLLHKVKEIRLRALKLGLQTCALLGPNAAVSSALRDALDVPLENNGSKFVTALCERLMGMVSNGESGPQVPQIWSLIILLLRTKRWSVVQWPHLKDWLLVIQKCFNCSDTGIKIEALMAWDRFVFALSSDESTSKEITNMLLRPILSQLERKKSEKYLALHNQAFSSYRNILYYAFRPSASHERLDACWKEYVSKPVLNKLNSHPNNSEQACLIISSLLWNPQPKVWDEAKGNKSSSIELEDLPRLDCKWVRSRLSNILPVFESLFKSSVWRSDALLESGIAQAWTNLMKALADAASKEITPSSESMQGLASILGLLQRLWKSAPSSLNAAGDNRDEAFYDRFHFLARTVISWIGPIPLTDKVLLKTSQETYQTTHTPTHHRPQPENLKSPMIHLVQIICSPPLSELGPAYIRLLHGIIELSMHSRKTRASQLDMLRQLVQLHLDNSRGSPEPGHLHALPLKYIWQTVARLARECLTSFKPNTEATDWEDSSQNDYDKVTKILCAGTKFGGAHAEWAELLHALSTTLRTEKGENAITAVIETLAEQLSSVDTPGGAIVYAPALLDAAVMPPPAEESTAAANVNANKFLLSRQNRRVSSDKLLAVVNKTLAKTYESLAETDVSGVVKFLEAMISFENRCPSGSRPAFLVHIQEGLALWLRDQEAKLTVDAGVDGSIIVSARSHMVSSINMLQSSFDSDHSLLSKLAPLITAGLESRHKSTVNGFIRMWNNTFGALETVDYPSDVENALRKLRPFADLRLPGFPSGPETETDVAAPQLISSQEDDGPLNQTPRDKRRITSRILDKKFSPSPSRATTPSTTSRERRRKRNNTPLSRSVTTPKSRLRHDDSQIQFVAVESSPTADDGLETQVLTENQKEVRDRQRDETAKMFPNIRSSVSRATEESDCNSPFSRHNARQVKDTSLSPMVHAAMGASEDEFPGSSPTPGSKNRNARLQNLHEPMNMSSLEDMSPLPTVDPPSSPPRRQSESPKRPVEEESNGVIPEGEKFGDTIENISPAAEEVSQDGAAHEKTGEEAPEEMTVSSVSDPKGQLESNNNDGDDVGMDQPSKDTESPKASTSRKSKERTSPSKQNRGAPRNPNRSPKTGRFTSDSSDRISIIPDSFSDELEQQIASQLEQDIEMSMEVEKDGSRDLRSEQQPATKSTKRKREESNPARPSRTKRPSPDSRVTSLPGHGSVRRQPSVEIICPAPGMEGNTRSTASSVTSRPRRTLRATHSSPGPQTDERKDSSPTGNKRPRNRRSLRLGGHMAPDIEPDDGPRQRKRQKSEEPESQSQALSTQDSDAFALDNGNDAGDPERKTKNSQATPSHEPEAVDAATATDQPPAPPSPGGILSSLRSVLGSLRNATLGRSVLREIDDVMFDIKVEAYGAARRHEDESG